MINLISNLRVLIIVASIFVVSLAGAAEIEETVLGMNVSGNKEAPNLLYIIPWKDSSADATPPEIYRLMDEVYSTVDPDVFEKEMVFYQQLTATSSVDNDESDED